MIELEQYVDQLDYLDHDYDPYRDDAMIENLIKLLGEQFPVAVLDQVKKHYSMKANMIEAKTIPELMMENGVSEIKTSTGLIVKLRTEYTVKTEDQNAMAQWVESNGGESLYKRALRFGKGEDISAIISAAEQHGLSYEQAVEIHPQTLKKFVKDFIEDKGSFPPEEAGVVSMYTHAVVTRSKK